MRFWMMSFASQTDGKIIMEIILFPKNRNLIYLLISVQPKTDDRFAPKKSFPNTGG